MSVCQISCPNTVNAIALAVTSLPFEFPTKFRFLSEMLFTSEIELSLLIAYSFNKFSLDFVLASDGIT